MLWEIKFYKVLEVPCHQDLATTDLFHLHNRNQEMEGIEGNLAMKPGQGGCLAHCRLRHWCKGSLWCRITGRRGLPEVSHSFPGQTKLYWSKRGFWQKVSCRPWQLECTEAQWKHRNCTRGAKKSADIVKGAPLQRTARCTGGAEFLSLQEANTMCPRWTSVILLSLPSGVLGLQEWVASCLFFWCWDWNQGFLHAGQTLFQLSYIPTPRRQLSSKEPQA